MPSSIKFGKIFGVEIGVHWSWIPIFIIFTALFADGTLAHFFPNWSEAALWTAGAITSAIFFASLLAHELAHSFVARSKGLEVKGITLFFIGGVSNLGGEPASPGDEFQISIVGPLTSLVMGGVFAIGWVILSPISPGIAGVSAQLAVINATLAVFNMVPGFPLDGGRVFRSILWQRTHSLHTATRIAAMAGEGVGYLLIAAGIVFFLFGNVLNGVYFFVIGLFLRGIAAGSYQQMLTDESLTGLKAGDAAARNCEPVPPGLSLENVVDDYVLLRNVRCFPVESQDHLLGLVTLEDIRHIPRDQWPVTPVEKAMVSFDRLHAVSPDDDLRNVLRLMAEQDVNQVPVVEDGRLVGLIARSDILRLIQTRRELAQNGGH
ncbi:MAG: site-2 protease family protein [Dehalococcoidia bacterium]|jgi:Zn-dependent protease